MGFLGDCVGCGFSHLMVRVVLGLGWIVRDWLGGGDPWAVSSFVGLSLVVFGRLVCKLGLSQHPFLTQKPP